MADDQQFSAQDLEDLRQIRQQLPSDHPKAGQLDSLLKSQGAGMPNKGLAPPVGSGIKVQSTPEDFQLSPSPELQRIKSTIAAPGGLRNDALPFVQSAQFVGTSGMPAGLGKRAIQATAPKLGSAPEVLTDAFNPKASQMPKFETNAGQIGNVQDFAERNNIPLADRESVVNAAQGAAGERRDFFNNKLLAPIADQPSGMVRTPEGKYMPRREGIAGEPTSYGEMSARLAEINNTLNPKYEKGMVAVNAEQAAPLRAEAAQIRSILYPAIAQYHGLPVEDVANVRESYGQLNDLAMKGGAALNLERHAANVEAQKPISFNPFAKGDVSQFATEPLTRKIGQAVREARGTTPDAMVARSLQTRYPSSPFPTIHNFPEEPSVMDQLIEAIKRQRGQ